MNENTRPKNLILKQAQLLPGQYKNFSGAGSRYNPEGKRNFCVILDPETTDALIEEGWNVKFTKPKDASIEPTPYLKVNVSYAKSTPNVKLITAEEGRVTRLTEKTIGEVDYAEIQYVDLNITPSFYDMGDGKTGYSAYLKSMNVIIDDDPVGDMYEDDFDDEEE